MRVFSQRQLRARMSPGVSRSIPYVCWKSASIRAHCSSSPAQVSCGPPPFWAFWAGTPSSYHS